MSKRFLTISGFAALSLLCAAIIGCGAGDVVVKASDDIGRAIERSPETIDEVAKDTKVEVKRAPESAERAGDDIDEAATDLFGDPGSEPAYLLEDAE